MLKVSVIIPNYNHARFIKQRIDSVLNQTFQDFEIIFLDDASTDNSREVFSKYKNNSKFRHIIVNDTNSNSTFKQWNKGISLATGEYIWIAESDDYAAPRFLEELVPILEQYRNVGLTYCQSYLIDEIGNLLSPNFLACTDCLDRKRWTANYLNKGINECENFLAAKNTIPNASAVLFRKDIYESAIGQDNEAFTVAGDWVTWSEILLASDIYFISESLNYFRSCEGSVSRTSAKLPSVIRESLSIFTRIQERVTISHQAQKVFFNLVSNWWLNHLVIGNILYWKREFGSYQDIVKISPNYKCLLSLQGRLLLAPINRLRYMLKLGTRVHTCRGKLTCWASGFVSLLKL